MSIRPEMKALYPKDWPKISAEIIARSPFCKACGQKGNLVTGTSKGNNYLTVHHIDHNPANTHPSNTPVLCQCCHLRREVKDQALARRQAKIAHGQLELPSSILNQAKADPLQ